MIIHRRFCVVSWLSCALPSRSLYKLVLGSSTDPCSVACEKGCRLSLVLSRVDACDIQLSVAYSAYLEDLHHPSTLALLYQPFLFVIVLSILAYS